MAGEFHHRHPWERRNLESATFAVKLFRHSTRQVDQVFHPRACTNRVTKAQRRGGLRHLRTDLLAACSQIATVSLMNCACTAIDRSRGWCRIRSS